MVADVFCEKCAKLARVLDCRDVECPFRAGSGVARLRNADNPGQLVAELLARLRAKPDGNEAADMIEFLLEERNALAEQVNEANARVSSAVEYLRTNLKALKEGASS